MTGLPIVGGEIVKALSGDGMDGLVAGVALPAPDIRAVRHIPEYTPLLAELWRRAGLLQIGYSQTFASAVRCCSARRMAAGTFACPKGESDCGGKACRSINAGQRTGTDSAGMAANHIGVLARLRYCQRPRKWSRWCWPDCWRI